MPKIVNIDEKRREIATCAIPLFLKNGYEKTTLQNVAVAAKIGRSTLYQYFNNKEEIFYEVCRFIQNKVEEEIDDIFSNSNLKHTEKILSIFSLLNNIPFSEVSHVFRLKRIFYTFEYKSLNIQAIHEKIRSNVKNAFHDILLSEAKLQSNYAKCYAELLFHLWENMGITFYSELASKKERTLYINSVMTMYECAVAKNVSSK